MRVGARVVLVASALLSACQLISGLEPFELANTPPDASVEGSTGTGDAATPDAPEASPPDAATDAVVDAPGAVVRYDFDEGSGLTVLDKVGSVNLTVVDAPDASSVWTDGGIFIPFGAHMTSALTATSLAVEQCNAANAYSVVAWVRPTRTDLGGPARIVTLSVGTADERDFTLAADDSQFHARASIFETSAGTVVPNELTHLVLTRDTGGVARLYVNAAQVGGVIDAVPLAWQVYPLTFANESTLNRQWEGEFLRFELFCAALSAEAVQAQFTAGP